MEQKDREDQAAAMMALTKMVETLNNKIATLEQNGQVQGQGVRVPRSMDYNKVEFKITKLLKLTDQAKWEYGAKGKLEEFKYPPTFWEPTNISTLIANRQIARSAGATKFDLDFENYLDNECKEVPREVRKIAYAKLSATVHTDIQNNMVLTVTYGDIVLLWKTSTEWYKIRDTQSETETMAGYFGYEFTAGVKFRDYQAKHRAKLKEINAFQINDVHISDMFHLRITIWRVRQNSDGYENTLNNIERELADKNIKVDYEAAMSLIQKQALRLEKKFETEGSKAFVQPKAKGKNGSKNDCHNWQRTGKCKFGEKCRFKHNPEQKGMQKSEHTNKPWKDKVCGFCQKTGHTQKYCRTSKEASKMVVEKLRQKNQPEGGSSSESRDSNSLKQEATKSFVNVQEQQSTNQGEDDGYNRRSLDDEEIDEVAKYATRSILSFREVKEESMAEKSPGEIQAMIQSNPNSQTKDGSDDQPKIKPNIPYSRYSFSDSHWNNLSALGKE
jgi:hypothetical protein